MKSMIALLMCVVAVPALAATTMDEKPEKTTSNFLALQGELTDDECPGGWQSLYSFADQKNISSVYLCPEGQNNVIKRCSISPIFSRIKRVCE